MDNDRDPLDELDRLFGPDADSESAEAAMFAAELKFEWDMQRLIERGKRGRDRYDDLPR